MLEGYVYMYEYMILVISWVITFCIVCAIITIISVKIFEWTEYRNEENYSIIWGRGGKKPGPTNKDIDDLKRKFEFLKELTENLGQIGELMKQISISLQAQIDDLSQRGEIMNKISDNLQAQIVNLQAQVVKLDQKGELMEQISTNLQAQVDELADRKGKRRPSSNFNILKAEINKVINDNNEQDNGANSPAN